MRRLLLIGLNHTTAPLDVRERLAFAPHRTPAALAQLRALLAGGEAVILSTCNRVELYLSAADEIDRAAVVGFLADFHGVAAEAFAEHLYEMRGRAVVEHLFGVASSLDSMVLGETQILGQVRGAYETSLAAGATGPLLNPLFQRAVAVGREVLGKSRLSEGRVSVASVAVDYARRIFDHFGDKTVLCVGTGKMAALVLRRFAELKPGRLLVCSRDADRAAAVAEPFGGTGVLFSDMQRHLVQSDIVITSTGAPHAVITRQTFEGLLRQRRYRPIFLIDIAVPRDVEAGVGELESVYLYNLDDLQEVVLQTAGARQSATDVARRMVSRQVEAFTQWHRQRAIGPLIDALYKRSGEIAQAELQRTLGKMQPGDKDRAYMEELVHRIVQKILHEPVRQLRDSEPHEGVPGYAHALEKLFGLNRAESPERDAANGPQGENPPQA